jgi:hypothetical protein
MRSSANSTPFLDWLVDVMMNYDPIVVLKEER